MVEAFKTINTKNGNTETIYAVTTGKLRKKEEALKAVASYKKESLARVKAKFKRIEPGYLVVRRGELLLYEADGGKGPAKAVNCVIARH